MWRPASFAVLTVPLLVPQARAQALAGDSIPAFRLSYRYASVGVASVPALVPGGRLGLRVGAPAVALAWARRVRDALPPIDVAHPPVPVVPAAVAAAPGVQQGPTVFRAAGATGVLGQFASLGMDLSLRFELKADQFRNLKCNAFEKQQAVSGCTVGFPTITPTPQYAIRSGGVVGQRLHVNVDFDSQREFDANNNLQVWYEGLEDEIVRRVEAGNVSFQVPGSRFISAAIPANNFGIQAVTQFGALELRGIYAQQKGNVVRDRTYNVGETTTQPLDRQFRDLDYEQGRFFFAVDPAAIPGFPAVDILNLPPLLPDSLQVQAIQVYRYRALSPSATNVNIGGIKAVACGTGTLAVDCAVERAGPFQWELLQLGKDYYVDPSNTWFTLTTRLDPSDFLAVSYLPRGQVECGPGSRCVGTFPVRANPDTTHVDTLRLVYDPRPGVTAASPAFRFEIRSAYRLGGQELSRTTLALELSVNQRERPEGSSETYLSLLGIALATDANSFDQYNRLFPRERDFAGPLRDYFVVFPNLRPFADPTKLIAAERNDSLYRTPRALLAVQGPPSVFTLTLHGNSSAAGDKGTLSLSSFQLREGSEKLYLGNTLLTRDVDYSIDYTVGLVTFKHPDSLFTTGPAVIRAQFEERATFTTAPTSIYGMAAKYDLGTAGQVYLTGLFQKQQTLFTRPQLGFEPASSFIGGVSTNLHFQPGWLTQAVRILPGTRSDAPSFVTVTGEVALSRPRPNPLGQAFIEEFEGTAGRFVSLNENSWHWGSVPSSSRGATPFGIPITGFDTVDAVPLTWQSLPLDGKGNPVQFFPRDIDPTIVLVGQAQSAEPVLWLMLKPDTMMGLANSNTGNPNWRRPGLGNNARNATRWRSITQTLSATGVDLSRVEYLEFWVWEDNKRSAKSNGGAILFDFGSVFEDALAFVPETLTVTNGDTTYSGVRVAGQGRLDTERDPVTHAWNAAINDEGILTDRITDGIWKHTPTGDSLIDTLPLCSATVSGQIVSRFFGDPRSRCGRHNGAIDTEDLDGDGQLDIAVGAKSQEDFVRYVFPIGDDQFYVRDGGMVNASPAAGGGASGWRLYRIPFHTDTLQVGAPNLRQVQALRITILAPETAPGEADPQIFFGLSRVQLVGATWLKRADTPIGGLGGDHGTGLGSVTASVVSTQNRDLGYTPPPGVVNEAARQDAGLQLGVTQVNEQSLRILATGLVPGQRAEAFTRFGSEGDKNFLGYRQLRVWARGRGPGWEDGDLEFYLKVGKDVDNFYLYHTPARTSSWEPEVVMQLDRWIALRARIQQAWLAGQAPHVYPGCPDSTVVPNDTTYVMCDGPYVVHVKDPGVSPPNLAGVQELAAGLLRVRSTTFIDQAEVWVDDIRLSDVVQTAGTAAALDVALTASNLADVTLDVSRRDGNFRQLGEAPTYQTTNGFNLASTLHLERFLPPSWGLAAPLVIQYAGATSAPIYLSGTDLPGDALVGLRTPLSTATSYTFSLRRSRRTRHGMAHWLADPLSFTATYLKGDDRSNLDQATSRTWSSSVDYSLQPGSTTIPAAPRFLVNLVRKLPPFIGKSAFADGLEHSRLRLSPTSIRLRSTLTSSTASRSVFRVPVADSGDRNIIPALSLSRAWRNSASLGLGPLPGLALQADLASQRDLRDYGDSTTIARVAGLARRSLFGTDVGFESQRTIGTFSALTPNLFPWLRPRAALATSFILIRDPNGRTPIRDFGDSAGAFHLPTSFSNSQHAELGTQLDVGRLGRGIFGDSSRVTRWLRKVTLIDVAYSRDRTSTFSGVAAAPSLGYQFAVVGFGGFLIQQGALATSATNTATTRATTTMGLPLGFRVTGLYQQTNGQTLILRVTQLVPITTASREWPSGTLSWTVSPSRSSLGRILSGLTAQLSVRYHDVTNTQSSLAGGSTAGFASSFSKDHSVSPSVTASWAKGVLTSFDATRLVSDQITAGNTYRTTHNQRNASVSFAWRPPPAILKLKTSIRTTARYSYALNATCLQSAGQGACVPYVDSRHSEGQLTLDTSFPPTLSAGLQVAYDLDDERQVNRKVSQLTLTAFVQLNTNVGQIR
jgi:hypothetical protein